MKIPFVDFKKQYGQIKKEVEKEVKEVLNSGHYVLGPKLENFEKKFADFCQVKYAFGVNNGTSALLLALLALGVKRGDEVITQPNTFVATVEAIVLAGAKPIFVDIYPKTYNLNPKLIKRAINKRTKVILPVHLFGRPNDMATILKIARKHKLFVVEDCAQAHGAKIRNKKAGSFGDIGCFSFYPTKVLGAMGEGGAVVTNNKKLAENIKKIRDHGSEKKYLHSLVGFNFRLEALQGAILGVKMKYLNQWIKARQRVAKIYHRLLKDLPLVRPFEDKISRSVYYVYVIRTKDREKMQNHLSEQGIGTLIHYPVPVHLQTAFRYLGYKKGDFPAAEKAAQEILSLPFWPEITGAEQKYVAQKIKEFFKNVQ